MEFADDTHLCLRCSETIVGLQNYILHRQQHCLGVHNVLQTCKALPNVNTSLLPSTSAQSHISASDFFTSLELQSKVPPPIPFSNIDFDAKLNDVFEYVSSDVANSIFSDLKSVKNYIYSPEKGEESEGEDPPPTHTGGKWKPGFGPDRLANRGSPSIDQKDYFDLNEKRCETNTLECLPEVTSYETDGFIDETHDANRSELSHDANRSELSHKVNRSELLHDANKSELSHDVNRSELSQDANRNELSHDVNVEASDIIQQPVDNIVLPLNERIRKGYDQVNEALTCEVCDIHNLDSYDMYLHVLSKKHRLNFEVDFQWAQHIFKNEGIMIKNSIYQCQLCPYYFNRPSAFMDHIKTNQHQLKAAQSKRNLTCYPCEFECLGNDDLIKHLTNEHHFLPYTSHPLIITEKNCNGFCNYCKGTCKGLYNIPKQLTKHLMFPLTNHLNITLVKELKHGCIKCPFCHFLTENTSDWTSHLFDNHSNRCRRPLLADIKCTMYLQMDDLNHDATSENIGDNDIIDDQLHHIKIECLLCDSIFDSEHFYMHVSMQHWEIAKLGKDKKHVLNSVKYECSKCPYKTSWRNSFLKHEATHLNERPRPFACSECNSAFFYKELLHQHQKLHSIPKYKCTVCTREFHTNSELKRHKKVHLEVYPYLCDTCSYRAKMPQLLKRHARVHTKERPFKCKHCSFSSATCSQLLRHDRVHSGSKPYNCPYCSYSCNTQENLRKHVLKTKKHQNMKMYLCKFCAFKCNMFNQYRNHLLNNHKDHFPRGEKDIISPVTVSSQSDEHETTVD